MGYKLVEKEARLKDTFIITIVGDSNDGDYVTETNEFDRKTFEECLPELINLRDNYSGNHKLSDYPNKFDLYIPYNGYDGYCHSLEKLTVEYIDKDGKIWDVKYE